MPIQSSLFSSTLTPLQRADEQRLSGEIYETTSQRAQLGQYPTPLAVAQLMASLLPVTSGQPMRLLDPGIGMGALSLAVLERHQGEVQLFGYDVDAGALSFAKQNLQQVALAAPASIRMLLHHADYLTAESPSRPYSHCIINPPYKKLAKADPRQPHLHEHGIHATNLYVAFVWKALVELSEGGYMVAIIPRSFANGTYYKPFRRFLYQHAHVERIHLFKRRDELFADNSILQENVILVFRKTQSGSDARAFTAISNDDGILDLPTSPRTLPSADVWWHPEQECILRIPQEAPCNLPKYSLDDLKVQVSTGPVVDFRNASFLCSPQHKASFPLLRPRHFRKTRCTWPLVAGKRKDSILLTPETEQYLWPCGFYVVVRRISSKEEPRRVIASLVTPTDFEATHVAFENHLNVFHQSRAGLKRNVALGLVAYLNSEIVDQFIRSISGHTQINAGDLRLLPYPSLSDLQTLYAKITSS